MRKTALLPMMLAISVVLVSFLAVGLDSQALACKPSCRGVVDKAPCEEFTVKIAFKNDGEREGTWSVNIAFEGESWSWSGTAQWLTLKPCKTKILTWKGSVPCDAPVNSFARLVVYYNDSFTPLDWWIHVVSGAELTITSSSVK